MERRASSGSAKGCRSPASSGLRKRTAGMSSETATIPDATSTTLMFGPWYRKSPFFEAPLRWGCKAYDIYNHMYLPGYFSDAETEYWALVNDVTLWDVAVERVVEISGPVGF